VTITNSDLNELLDAVRAGGDIDVVRRGVELILQALIDAEATAQIGADRFERSTSRTTQRNGTRDRLLSTKAGDVDLKIPKLRQGSFFPSILARRLQRQPTDRSGDRTQMARRRREVSGTHTQDDRTQPVSVRKAGQDAEGECPDTHPQIHADAS
jgi:hypothetical protein